MNALSRLVQRIRWSLTPARPVKIQGSVQTVDRFAASSNGLFNRLTSLVPGFRAPAPPQIKSETIRPAPSTEERVPSDPYRGIAGRIWFLPYLDATSTNDTLDVRIAMRRMITDPYVKTAWLTQILTVLAQDFQVHPDPELKGNVNAERHAKFVRHVLENADGGMVGIGKAVLFNFGSDGATLAEKVWQIEPKGRWVNKMTLKALKAKDFDDVMLLGDEYRNITGVRVNTTGETWPISDFTYARYLDRYDEPYGMAAFRAAYGAYWMRDTVRKLRIIHHEKKMAGMLIGTYTDPSDKPGLEQALMRAKSSTWLTIPEGVRVAAEQISTASEPDYKSFDESLREEILIGIALAHLHILQGAAPDARGDTKVHKAVADLGPWLLTYLLQIIINRQIIPDIIDYNEPACLAYPTITLGGVTNQEALETLQVIEGGQRIGLKPSRTYAVSNLAYQEADPNDQDDQLQPPQPQMGGLPGMGGPGGGDPFGGQDPFAGLPGGEEDQGGGQGGQSKQPFSEQFGYGVQKFAWLTGKRGGKYWLAKGKQDLPANRLYGAAGRKAAGAGATEVAPQEPARGAPTAKPQPAPARGTPSADSPDLEDRIAYYQNRATNQQPLFDDVTAEAAVTSHAVRKRMAGVAEAMAATSARLWNDDAGSIDLDRATVGIPKQMATQIQTRLTDLATGGPEGAESWMKKTTQWVGSLGAVAGKAAVRGLAKAAWWLFKKAAIQMGRMAWAFVGPPIIWAGQAYKIAGPIALHLATIAGAAGLVAASTYLPPSIPFVVKLLAAPAAAWAIRRGIKYVTDKWTAPLLTQHPEEVNYPGQLKFSEEDWNGPHKGERGGTFWTHAKTGAIEYSKTNPGGAAGVTAPDEPAKDDGQRKSPAGRAKAVLDAAAKIPILDRPAKGSEDPEFDPIEVERNMTDSELARMNSVLGQARSSAINEAMEAKYPRGFEIDLNYHDLAEEAGWGSLTVADEAKDLLKNAEELDGDQIEQANDLIDTWYHNTDSAGIAAIHELAAQFDHEGFDDSIVKTVQYLETRATEAIEAKRDEMQQKAEQEALGEIEDKVDENDDYERESYLREFHADHSHEDRYSQAPEYDVWGKVTGGSDLPTQDWSYHFQTAAGQRYNIEAQSSRFHNVPIMNVSFGDSQGAFDVTGAGNAVEVFSRVTAAVTALLHHAKPPFMSFTAAKEDNEKRRELGLPPISESGSRQKLYDRLVKTLAGLNPEYTAIAFQEPNQGPKRYFIMQKAKAEEVMRQVQAKGITPEVLTFAEHLARPIAGEINEDWFHAEGWKERTEQALSLFAEGWDIKQKVR